MRAQAPGKVVLSGAYAVLRGAPALVTAASRYVVADGSRSADFVTAEVEVALRELEGVHAAPWFDASALRARDAKLGLGSSAAILVASLGALFLAQGKHPGGAGTPSFDSWRQEIFERSLRAHRRAQGGGSGIDVAAAALGGTLLARLETSAAPSSGASHLRLEPLPLPNQLCLELWAMGRPASTAHFVQAVFELERTQPERFEALLGAQAEGARRTAEAARAGDVSDLIRGLQAQRIALDALGQAAGIPIVVDELRALADVTEPGAALLPAGAGGGDISVYAGPRPSSAGFRDAATRLGMWLIEADLGAPGLQPIDS